MTIGPLDSLELWDAEVPGVADAIDGQDEADEDTEDED